MVFQYALSCSEYDLVLYQFQCVFCVCAVRFFLFFLPKNCHSPFKPNGSKDKDKGCKSVPGSMATLRHVQRERKGGQEGWTVAQKLIVLAGFPIRAAHTHPNPRLNTPTSLSNQQHSYKSLPPLFLLV